MKNISILFVLFLIVGCDQKKGKKTIKHQHELESGAVVKKRTGPAQNYAVVFNWTTQDEKLVMENAMVQADQLLTLWKSNTIENVYYDAKAQYDKFSYFPNITFTLKAESIETARSILDDLVVVKKGIAAYTTYPIGTLWLKRNAAAIKERGRTSSYVAVWTTDYTPEDTMIKGQNEKILSLWNEGKIENVYFDIEGTQKENNKTDFVFFINADSEEEAKAIIDPLPFVRNAIASYKLHPVGLFWMGINE